MRALISFAILLTVSVQACDFPSVLSSEDQPAERSNPGDLIALSTTGGIAGVNRQLVIDASGKASYLDGRLPGPSRVAQLEPEELDALIDLFLENDFFQLKDEYIDGRVADAFLSAVSFSHGGTTKTVRTNLTSGPANLQRILTGLGQLQTRISEQLLDLGLQLSAAEINVGDEVVLSLSVTNVTSQKLVLRLSSGQVFDFFAFPSGVATAARDAFVWNWAQDKAFAQYIWTLDLEAGETRSYQATWDGQDRHGNQVVGTIMMGADLVSIPGGQPQPQMLTIRGLE